MSLIFVCAYFQKISGNTLVFDSKSFYNTNKKIRDSYDEFMSKVNAASTILNPMFLVQSQSFIQILVESLHANSFIAHHLRDVDTFQALLNMQQNASIVDIRGLYYKELESVYDLEQVPERLLGVYMLMHSITQPHAQVPANVEQYSARVQTMARTMCNRYHQPNDCASARFVPVHVSAYKHEVVRQTQIRAFHAFYLKRCPVAMQQREQEAGHVLGLRTTTCELCGLTDGLIDETYMLKYEHVFTKHFFTVYSPKLVLYDRVHEDTVDISVKYEHNDLV